MRPPRPLVAGRQFVFIGGYYYDPFFGPYPWWPRTAYPHRYFPVYDLPAEVRVIARPRETAVYVDGFYAGIVDDFDGIFQKLPLPPGGHDIVLYLAGHRTAHFSIYLTARSVFRLHHTMQTLPPGVVSEPPPTTAAVPPPPPGTYAPPRTPSPVPASPSPSPSAPTSADVGETGTLNLRVQPGDAVVTIDGQRWMSSDAGSYVIDIPSGRRRLEISLQGYRTFTGEVEVKAGETTPLNVSLSSERPR